jgi:hypothetical protein
MPKLKIRTQKDQLRIGDVTLTFQRTLRFPDDGSIYPLTVVTVLRTLFPDSPTTPDSEPGAF